MRGRVDVLVKVFWYCNRIFFVVLLFYREGMVIKRYICLFFVFFYVLFRGFIGIYVKDIACKGGSRGRYFFI